jgi:hypothetical protein
MNAVDNLIGRRKLRSFSRHRILLDRFKLILDALPLSRAVMYFWTALSLPVSRDPRPRLMCHVHGRHAELKELKRRFPPNLYMVRSFGLV